MQLAWRFSGSKAIILRNEEMIEETLQTYRQERRAFIIGLKNLGIDFYSLDRRERSEWLRSYIQSKRDFFESMLEHWKDEPPMLSDKWPQGYSTARKGRKSKRPFFKEPSYDDRSRR